LPYLDLPREIKKAKNFRKDEDAGLFNVDIEECNNFRESAIVDR
jgi:hypothetical protein